MLDCCLCFCDIEFDLQMHFRECKELYTVYTRTYIHAFTRCVFKINERVKKKQIWQPYTEVWGFCGGRFDVITFNVPIHFMWHLLICVYVVAWATNKKYASLWVNLHKGRYDGFSEFYGSRGRQISRVNEKKLRINLLTFILINETQRSLQYLERIGSSELCFLRVFVSLFCQALVKILIRCRRLRGRIKN